jgi:hypothetical protein
MRAAGPAAGEGWEPSLPNSHFGAAPGLDRSLPAPIALGNLSANRQSASDE